jgi:hypothetical protein
MLLTEGTSAVEGKWHVNWLRVSLGLIVCFAAIWLVGEAMQSLSPWYEARSLFRQQPALERTPSPIRDKSVAPLPGFQVELFGLAVQTPWNRSGTIQLASNLATIPFPEQHVAMMLFKPSSNDFERRMFAQATRERDDAGGISNYKLVAAEMFATPDDVKWWRGIKRNEAQSFLLEMKALRIADLTEIYSIDFGNFKGFQVGNPSMPPYRILLDLVDVNDRYYQIRIGPTDRHGPIISQAQINAVVASIHQLPDHP